MPSFKIYEPHPSTAQNTYTHSGRGGAGNHFKAPRTTAPELAHGPASLFTHGLPPSATTKFSGGRGGAGNIHPVKQKEVYDFDEELRRQITSSERVGGVHLVGRGGAGNWAKKRVESGGERRQSEESRKSEESEGRRSSLFERVRGSFERR